jgi:septation ring formation regulator EzrA
MIDLEQLDTYIMELENTISALSRKVDVMKDEQDLVSVTIKDFEEAVREAEERTLNYNKQLEVIIRELNKNN